MKKFLSFFSIILFISIGIAVGQDTTNVNVQHVEGQGVLEFLKSNWAALVVILLLAISEWMGESGKFPEGSIWRKVVNFLIKLVKGKVIYTSKKVDYARRKGLLPKIIIIAILLTGITVSSYAQSPWRGMIKPVPKDLLSSEKGLNGSGEFLVRFDVGIIATKVTLSDEDGKLFDMSPLAKAGPGISYSHYVDKDGVPYNNYSFTGLLLLPITDNEPAAFALGVSAFNMNVGLGLDMVKATPFKHMVFGFFGAQYTF